MRLHSGDDEPDADEPDEGWVEASPAATSTPLSDVLNTWSVVRRWRGVQARSAAEAIEATRRGTPHDHLHATRQEMGLLYLTRDELTVLLTSVSASIAQTDANLELAQSDEVQSALRYSWQVLNSLRTAVAEARYDLMTPDEINEELKAIEEARAAGIIK